MGFKIINYSKDMIFLSAES